MGIIRLGEEAGLTNGKMEIYDWELRFDEGDDVKMLRISLRCQK
jgi:hypothetical protein